ncbi:MAG: hypothetical protein IT372_30400, partial [Polyangiaceae bacterium]|nr:hypothetical protein [Polyangiaceae bacterium]
MSWRESIASLLGFAAATAQVPRAREEAEDEERMPWRWRKAPPPTSVTRWYLADLEKAIHEADQGDLSRAAQLCRALRRDGVLHGVLSTRTGGLVRLPRRFSGDPQAVAALGGHEGKPGIFDEMFPAPELALLAGDGILLGVGVAELLP